LVFDLGEIMEKFIISIMAVLSASSALADHRLVESAEKIAGFLASTPVLSEQDLQTISENFEQIEWTLRNYGYSERESNVFRFELENERLEVFARDTNQLLQIWNKHDKMTTRGPVLALLDSGREFAALRYENGKLTTLVSKWMDTTEFVIHRAYIGLLDSNGIAEAYSTFDGKKLIANWKDTVQHLFAPDFIVLRDREAAQNMEVYDTRGNRLIKLDGVSEFRMVRPYEISYVQRGQEKVLNIRPYLP